MFLGGVRALFDRAKVTPPEELSRRVSRLATDEQFAAFLQDNWPKSEAAADALVHAFTHGLLSRVTGRPDLIPAATAKIVEQSAANRYVGTGIQIRFDPKEELTQIVVPFRNGPARKAGAKPRDLIVEVDGAAMQGVKLTDVVERIRGDEGTEVTFTVRQPGEKETRLLKMVRAAVPFDTVVGYRRVSEDGWDYRLDPAEPIAYLRLETILPSTPVELRKLERELRDDGIKGIVLDLRMVAGVEMQPAALTADELLDGGVMWRLRGPANRVKEYRADRDCCFRDCKLVVLVDGHTRDGAEYLAAALQDNRRGAVVGEATHGEGYVSTLLHLPDGLGALRLRTGRVERAAPAKDGDEAANGWRPITPDKVVKLDDAHAAEVLSWRDAQRTFEPTAPAKKPPEDGQLAAAVEVLRKAIQK
jgi:carboxyl-terminal processing protease